MTGTETDKGTDFDPKRMIELEEELIALKAQQGIEERPAWWQRLGDRYAEYTVKSKVPVNRKKYIRLALTCGWLCGAHRFTRKKPSSAHSTFYSSGQVYPSP